MPVAAHAQARHRQPLRRLLALQGTHGAGLQPGRGEAGRARAKAACSLHNNGLNGEQHSSLNGERYGSAPRAAQRAHRVLEEQDLSIICGQQDVGHAIQVDVVQQRRGVGGGGVEGLKVGRLGAVPPLKHLPGAAGRGEGAEEQRWCATGTMRGARWAGAGSSQVCMQTQAGWPPNEKSGSLCPAAGMHAAHGRAPSAPLGAWECTERPPTSTRLPRLPGIPCRHPPPDCAEKRAPPRPCAHQRRGR